NRTRATSAPCPPPFRNQPFPSLLPPADGRNGDSFGIGSPMAADSALDASPARLLDGRALAAEHRARIAERVEALGRRRAIAEHDAAGSVPPAVRLDAVLVGAEDNAARLYAENQARTCAELGIAYRLHELPAKATYDDIAGRVLLLNTQPDVTAIMVHLPLPEGIDPYSIQRLIAPEKDVEGVNPANIGNIVYGRSSLAPCTALAAVRMIESTQVDLKGKTAVIVGASNHVGKPIAV